VGVEDCGDARGGADDGEDKHGGVHGSLSHGVESGPT
jgi:hypothetical protein